MAVEKLILSGYRPYEEVEQLQLGLFEAALAAKAGNLPVRSTLIVCEHPAVYTIGKSGDEKNMLAEPAVLGASLHRVSRGGDITFHGPGQLVAYPIFDLESLNLGLAAFVNALEEIIIRTAANYGLKAERLKGASGVWLEAGRAPRKLCALGLKASRYCTMHGLALNVNTDLHFFDHIVPCGLAGKGVTSLQRELGRKVEMHEVTTVFLKEMENVLGLEWV